MGVIQGRISEEEQAAAERLDTIGRQKSRIVDQLNTTYSLINMYMTNMGLDYQDATAQYNTEFNNNLKMYDIITGKERAARSDFESDRAMASANLTTYTNAIMSGNLTYSSLSSDQKSMITKLEVQSGMPVGFISGLKMDPGANILFTTSNEGITQVGVRNEDGSISVESYGTRIDGKSTSDKVNTRQRFEESTASGNYTFPDLVEEYATEGMNLDAIYAAYANTDMGKEFGIPTESRRAMRLTWEVAHGDISEDEARDELLGY